MRSHFSYVWLCDPTDCSPPGSSIHGILQARILEQAAMPSSRGSSRPRDQTWSPVSPAFAGGFFTTSATWESPNITVGITGKHKGNEFPPGHTVVSGYARTGCRQCGCLLGKTGNPGASSCPSSDRQQHSLSGQGAPDGDKSALGQRERGGWGRGGRGRREERRGKTQLVLLKGGSENTSKRNRKWRTLSREPLSSQTSPRGEETFTWSREMAQKFKLGSDYRKDNNYDQLLCWSFTYFFN